MNRLGHQAPSKPEVRIRTASVLQPKHIGSLLTLPARFAQHYVQPDGPGGCWIWTGKTARRGYGQVRGLFAHRVSYWLHKGIDPVGYLVCHSCDNPPCVNPDHLFLGNHQDNMDDAADKKRMPSRRKLTPEQVAQLRSLYGAGVSTSELADRFGVVERHVRKIVRGQAYGTEVVQQDWQRAGMRRSTQKVSDAMAEEIVRRYATGSVSQRALAREFGVSQASIGRVISRTRSLA